MHRRDLGKSYINGKDVFTEFQSRFNTLELAFTAILFASIISIPLRIYGHAPEYLAGYNRNGGRLVRCINAELLARPSADPAFLRETGVAAIRRQIRHYVDHPAGVSTVGLGQAAMIARTTRSSMLDVGK